MSWISTLSVLFVFLFHTTVHGQNDQLVAAAEKEGT